MSTFADVARDVRYATRAFRREPAFVAGIALTFALAIGATGAMVGLVNRLMFAPPPGIQAAEEVVRVAFAVGGDRGDSQHMSTTSYPVFRTLASLGSVFSRVAAVRAESTTIGRGEDLAPVAAVAATGSYFATLRTHPALGRYFGPGDDEFPHGNDVVVLGHAFWRLHFAADARVVGRQLIVDDRPLTVIGVAPPGFNGAGLAPVDLYLPLTTALRGETSDWSTNPAMLLVSIVARLRDGVSAAKATQMIAPALDENATLASGDRAPTPVLESLVSHRSGRASTQARIALWLSGVSLVVLLIATANVGTLLLLRAARRRRDVAVRLAMGAGRNRLIRQALVESLLLAGLGALIGLFVSRWFGEGLRLTILPGLAPADGLVDDRVVALSLIAATVAGLLAAVVPLASLGRRNVSAELRAGSGHGSSGRFLLQSILVSVQAALCTVLLIGAVLFVRSLSRVQSQDLGFSTAHLLMVTLDFRGHVPAAERDRVHEEAVRRVAVVPGVTGATVVQGMPFSSHNIPPINIPGYEMPPPSERQLPILYAATPAYLEMMGVTLKEGRLFDGRDVTGAPLVVLVNETMARTVWPGESAVGKCVRAGHGLFPPGPDVDPMAIAATLPCREVVGVVRDSRARSLRVEGDEDKLMQYYVPFAQLPAAPFPDVATVHAVLVRTAGDPAALVAPVQHIVQGTSAHEVLARVRPYQELIDPQLRDWRLGATLFSAFGALALGIAAVGLFAVVSYLVTQRSQEIGVRLALGGTGACVARLIVWDALRMTGGGAVAGTLVALIAAPLIQALLFQTSPREPASIAAAVAILLVVGAAAAAIPAWRASRVDPIIVLRAEV